MFPWYNTYLFKQISIPEIRLKTFSVHIDFQYTFGKNGNCKRKEKRKTRTKQTTGTNFIAPRIHLGRVAWWLATCAQKPKADGSSPAVSYAQR